MLSFMMNRWNCTGDRQTEEMERAGLSQIGISAQLPAWLRAKLAGKARVCLYDSGLAADACSEAEIDQAISDAQALLAQTLMLSAGGSCDRGRDEREAAAAMAEIQRKCREKGMGVALTNRRAYRPEIPVEAEKLLRLCRQTGCEIAFDSGFSHAYGRCLEDFHDLHERIAFLLMNDNYGKEVACWPVGHSDFDPTILPDDFRQPGYGTAPYPALGEAMRQYGMEIPLLINGMRHQNAALEVVMRETRRLLAGKVFINPAGGKIGRDWHTDRML